MRLYLILLNIITVKGVLYNHLTYTDEELES